MLKGLFLLCFLPVIIATELDGVEEDDLHYNWCGVRDPYDVYGSILYLVLPETHMNIYHGEIDRVQRDVFEYCGETLSLSIANNKLTVLSGKMLKGLRNLTVLNVFNNTIGNVLDGTFDQMPHLQELELSYNRLTGLRAEVRNGLRELRKLHLSHNPILLMENGFVGLSKLELLELTGANISTIPSGSFNGLRYLQRLDLSSNKLTDISASRFEGLIDLVQLDLSMNLITTISKDSFAGLENLKSLWLNNNRIGSLSKGDIFQNIPRLNNLYLHANPFGILDVAVFKDMQSVNIEPGFVINSGETVWNNFANAISTLYECRRQGRRVESEHGNSEAVQSVRYDYFLPYRCVLLITTDSEPNVTHTDEPTVVIIKV